MNKRKQPSSSIVPGKSGKSDRPDKKTAEMPVVMHTENLIVADQSTQPGVSEQPEDYLYAAYICPNSYVEDEDRCKFGKDGVGKEGR